jgi:hypothetical protein
MSNQFFMSWTNIFPVMDDHMLESYEQQVFPEKKVEYEELLGIQKILTSKRFVQDSGVRHYLSVALFWKNVNAADPELPRPNKDLMVNAKRYGLVKRFSPWESYVQPLLWHSAQVMERFPEVTFRIYLAADLEFLVPELLELGWEICLMKSNSIRYCPGGFWRFLALEEPNAIVTIVDSDRLGEADNDIIRTRSMHEMNLGLWRVPGYYNTDLTKQVRYRPILGGHFGASGGHPMRKLIEAFLWHSENNTLSKTCQVPRLGERPIQFTKWPDYGFDEWFQLVALYPRLVTGGTLTFIPHDARSLLLPIDLEYVTWANPRSEAIYC